MTTPKKKCPIFSHENADPNLPITKILDNPKPSPNPKPKPLPKERRKFIVVTSKNKKDSGSNFDPKKCQELAYKALKASHEDFFRKDPPEDVAVAEPGSGRVKQLVEAFETILTVSGGAGSRGPVKKDTEGLGSFRSDSRLCSSLDGDGRERLSWGNRRSSGGSQKSRRNSSDCLRGSWNKKLKVTSQQPFKLRTEQRGRHKEEIFSQKVKEMLVEEGKKRIPIAQGLPWTTDEPECLVKPPVKENTEPIDLVLHSDVRAVERAEFDHHIAERLSFAEQMRLEREKQQKLEEEEEIKRLRRELVPKAQPMPYFDRPFAPKRSGRSVTVPKEPRFHVRHKSSCKCFACGQMKRGHNCASK